MAAIYGNYGGWGPVRNRAGAVTAGYIVCGLSGSRGADTTAPQYAWGPGVGRGP